MMIPYGHVLQTQNLTMHRQFPSSRGNKKVYICFLVAFAMMAASPMRAADPAGSMPAVRTTFVVRADPHTGRLVRSTVVRDAAGSVKAPLKSAPPSKQISDIVDQAARAHQVDPLLVHSIIKVESNYNTYALSSKGAEGLMQLMPPTARMLGVSNSFDPRENIEAGVKYLKYLQGMYKDDRLALAAYNAGPAAVEKYKEVPPFKETRNYVEQVGRRYDDARAAVRKEDQKVADDAKLVAVAVLPAQIVVETHPKLEQSVDEHGRLSLKTVE
jgi:soluble lytic murein transglycosylase-like protein